MNENAQRIYDRLRQAGMTHAGAKGMLGNMKAESALIPNNAQNGMTKFSDEQYTELTNAGAISFYDDAVGYGLCQWTYAPRKKGLLEFARMRGVSIGDLDMQVDYCIKELKTDYDNLWIFLCTTTNSDNAADRICKEFEMPKVNNLEVRRQFALEFSTLKPTEENEDCNGESDKKREAIDLLKKAIAILEQIQ